MEGIDMYSVVNALMDMDNDKFELLVCMMFKLKFKKEAAQHIYMCADVVKSTKEFSG